MIKSKKILDEIKNLKNELEKLNDKVASLEKENLNLKQEFKLLEDFNKEIAEQSKLNIEILNESFYMDKNKRDRYKKDLEEMFSYD